MKSLKILTSTLIATLLLSTCEQSESPEPEIQEELVEIILLEESNHLQSLVNNIGFTPNGRTNSLLDDVDFDRAVKRFNPETGNTHYSFFMNSENGLAIRKFILTENEDQEISGHVFEYEVDAEWYYQQDSFPGWDQYNGYFRILDLDGIVVSENTIINGSSEESESSNGRTSGYTCFTYTNKICKGTASNPCQYYYYDTFTDCFLTGGGGSGYGGGDLDGYTPNPLPEYEVISFDEPLDDLGVSTSLSVADAWEQDICLTTNFSNNECVRGIWTLMKQNDVGFETLRNYIGDNPVADLCMDIKDLSDSEGDGPNGHNQQNWKDLSSTVVLNSSRLNRSKLDIARTLLHEMIHSELFSMVVQAGRYEHLQSFAESYEGDDPFLELWAYYDQYGSYIDGVNAGWQHEYMADNYIQYMADGLQELAPFLMSESFYNYFDGNGFYPTPNSAFVDWNWNDFYTAMAWRGLERTDEWNALSQNEKNKYKGYVKQLDDLEISSFECN